MSESEHQPKKTSQLSPLTSAASILGAVIFFSLLGWFGTKPSNATQVNNAEQIRASAPAPTPASTTDNADEGVSTPEDQPTAAPATIPRPTPIAKPAPAPTPPPAPVCNTSWRDSLTAAFNDVVAAENARHAQMVKYFDSVRITGGMSSQQLLSLVAQEQVLHNQRVTDNAASYNTKLVQSHCA